MVAQRTHEHVPNLARHPLVWFITVSARLEVTCFLAGLSCIVLCAGAGMCACLFAAVLGCAVFVAAFRVLMGYAVPSWITLYTSKCLIAGVQKVRHALS